MSSSADSGKSGDSGKSSKLSTKKGAVQPAKRPHSEVANTSAEEMTLVLAELSEIKTEIKQTIKKGDLESLVKEIVEGLMKKTEERFDKRINDIEKKYDAKIAKLQDDNDHLLMENNTLKEKIAEKSKTIAGLTETASDAYTMAAHAQRMANYNEQYSRKSNIKIYGLEEKSNENTATEVIAMLKADANVDLAEDEIVAVHRIPGKDDVRPILLKVKNTDVKARIMRNRSVIKKAKNDHRLADDVTKLNSVLIQRPEQFRTYRTSLVLQWTCLRETRGCKPADPVRYT